MARQHARRSPQPSAPQRSRRDHRQAVLVGTGESGIPPGASNAAPGAGSAGSAIRVTGMAGHRATGPPGHRVSHPSQHARPRPQADDLLRCTKIGIGGPPPARVSTKLRHRAGRLPAQQRPNTGGVPGLPQRGLVGIQRKKKQSSWQCWAAGWCSGQRAAAASGVRPRRHSAVCIGVAQRRAWLLHSTVTGATAHPPSWMASARPGTPPGVLPAGDPALPLQRQGEATRCLGRAAGGQTPPAR